MPHSPVMSVLGAVAALGALAIGSCSVQRLSERYACEDSDDCDGGRTCNDGFCVAVGVGVDPDCPAACTSCLPNLKICRIECDEDRPCPVVVECPAGFECDIDCDDTAACLEIDCAQSTSCDIDCTAQGACGVIECGTRECSIECSGLLACASISCAQSCQCDVECGGSSDCPSIDCPTPPGVVCTRNEVPGEACDSSVSVVCETCN